MFLIHKRAQNVARIVTLNVCMCVCVRARAQCHGLNASLITSVVCMNHANVIRLWYTRMNADSFNAVIHSNRDAFATNWNLAQVCFSEIWINLATFRNPTVPLSQKYHQWITVRNRCILHATQKTISYQCWCCVPNCFLIRQVVVYKIEVLWRRVKLW
jgi:hypothetical protein